MRKKLGQNTEPDSNTTTDQKLFELQEALEEFGDEAGEVAEYIGDFASRKTDFRYSMLDEDINPRQLEKVEDALHEMGQVANWLGRLPKAMMELSEDISIERVGLEDRTKHTSFGSRKRAQQGTIEAFVGEYQDKIELVKELTQKLGVVVEEASELSAQTYAEGVTYGHGLGQHKVLKAIYDRVYDLRVEMQDHVEKLEEALEMVNVMGKHTKLDNEATQGYDAYPSVRGSRRKQAASVKVTNMRTGEEQTFVGISPAEAVIAAYAQEHGDMNTWDYAKYTDDVEVSQRGVVLGDWYAKKQGRKIAQDWDKIRWMPSDEDNARLVAIEEAIANGHPKADRLQRILDNAYRALEFKKDKDVFERELRNAEWVLAPHLQNTHKQAVRQKLPVDVLSEGNDKQTYTAGTEVDVRARQNADNSVDVVLYTLEGKKITSMHFDNPQEASEEGWNIKSSAQRRHYTITPKHTAAKQKFPCPGCRTPDIGDGDTFCPACEKDYQEYKERNERAWKAEEDDYKTWSKTLDKEHKGNRTAQRRPRKTKQPRPEWIEHTVEVEIPIEEAAKKLGVELDPELEYGMEVPNAADLWFPIPYTGIERYLPTVAERAVMDIDMLGWQAAHYHDAIDFIERAFEGVRNVPCEYMGENEEGEQVQVRAKASIKSASEKNGVLTVVMENPEQLINAVNDGVGMFAADQPVDVGMDEVVIAKLLPGCVSNYYDVYENGLRYRPDVRDSGNVSDADMRAAVEMALGDATMEDVFIPEDEDVSYAAGEIEKVTNGHIKAQDVIKKFGG